MKIDSSIYSNQRTPNYVDSFQKGMSLGKMIKQNRLEDEERQKQQSLKDIYKSAFVKDEQGNTTFDYGKLADIAGYDPKAGVSLLGQRDSKEAAAKKVKADAEKFEKTYGLDKSKADTQKANWQEQRKIDWARLKADKKAAATRAKMFKSNLSPGELKVDQDYAKDYNDWKSAGGYSTIQRNLNDAKSVVSDLNKSDRISGPFAGMFGNTFVQDYVNPEAANVQDRINRIIMGSLKATLGAQFTEKEGKRVLEATFNPRQSEKVNATRLTGLINDLERTARAKEAAAGHYEKFGTLKGYKGPSVDFNFAPGGKKKSGASGSWGSKGKQKGTQAPGTKINYKGKVYQVGSDGESLTLVK